MPSPRRPCLLFLAALTAVAVAGVAVAADGPQRKFAAIDLNHVDADFPFQGEYYGPLGSGDESGGPVVGLQVVARGGGEFIALEYPGGLPGYGWYGGDKTPLTGRREGGRVVLSGSNRRYIVANDNAQSLDEQGNVLGSIIKVHRISRTMGQAPPKDAIVLFDGRQTDQWVNARVTEDGLLKEGTVTKEAYPDYFLHAEFQLSYMPYAREQGRSNSGIYLQRRYEVQVLDSFGLEGAFNECGSIYRFRKPDINMCLPPLNWQTYDIDFHAPRFDADGKKIENGRLTVLQNGYPVQDNVELLNKTGHGEPEAPKPLPILLQEHGNPVRFRNMWLVVHTPLAPSGGAVGDEASLAGADGAPCADCSVGVSPGPAPCASCSW